MVCHISSLLTNFICDSETPSFNVSWLDSDESPLRPYQAEAIEQILKAVQTENVMYVAPPAAGKNFA